MVPVRMGEDNARESRSPEAAQKRENRSLPLIEARSSIPDINRQNLPIRKFYQCTIPLADIDEEDTEPPRRRRARCSLGNQKSNVRHRRATR